jgi:transmembrane sensor
MTDASHGGDVASGEDEDLDRLVVRGLHAPLSPSDAAQLDALVARSPRHAARANALAETWMLSGALSAGAAQTAGRLRGSETGLLEGGATRRGLIAAGVIGAIGTPAVLWLASRTRVDIYQAPLDGPLRATLADGSRIVLSRGGRVEVRMDGAGRRVRQRFGEAFYAVAKDQARPFEVAVADHRLTVLGTQFNVDPDPAGLRIDLLEGALRVQVLGQPGGGVVLKPGQAYRSGRPPAVTSTDVSAAAAWIDGRLVFDDAPLSEVARNLNRQTGQTLAFADPGLSSMRFSGVLRIDASADWQDGLEAVLPIRLTRTQTGYRVSRR